MFAGTSMQGRIKGEARPRPLLPDPLMLPVGRNKGELSAVADPDLQIRSGGGVGLQKIFFGLKIRGARAPRAAPLDPQLIRSKANSDAADNVTCVASVSNRVIARKLERKHFVPLPLPLPRHYYFFFCSCPSFLDELREETLATQATDNETNARDQRHS